MKNRLFSLCIVFIWAMASGSADVHAFFPPYPYVLSPAISMLPQGSTTITVGDETFYYYQGVFYQKIIRDQKYVIVPPPIGAVIFNIPQAYQYMLIDGISYYIYKGVYYKRVLEGYRVIYPPI